MRWESGVCVVPKKFARRRICESMTKRNCAAVVTTLRGRFCAMQARAAAGDLPAVANEAFEHPVEGVVAVGCLLAGDRAGHGVTHEEDLDLGVVAPAG